MLSIPLAAPAQDAVKTEGAYSFSKEELTQMLAPIALYPDSLVAQILMASTYPLEIVEAERWLRDNKNLKGDALDDVLKEMNWDPSVKSLCHFPEVLLALSDKLDQTRKLGDAFLGQEDEVMATIQELRQKAEEQGNLRSSREQNVIVEQDIIRIEPANPEVVYVPVYDPLYVYGPWWYPSYPPYYWYYPFGVSFNSGFIGFGPSIHLGFGLFSWTFFDWNHRRIHIDVNKTHRFHRHHIGRDFDRHGRTYWRHDAGHRRGVAYRDRRTSDHFGGRPARLSPATPETRGFSGRRIDQRAPRGTFERREGIVTPGGRAGRDRYNRGPGRDTTFRGIGQGSFERRAGERGIESRRSGGFGRPGREIGAPAREIRPRGGEIRQPGGSEFRRQGGEIRRSGGDLRRSGGEFRQSGGGIRRSGGEFRQSGGGIRRSGGEFRQSGGGIRRSGGEFRQSGGGMRSSGGGMIRSGGDSGHRGGGGRGGGGGGRHGGGSSGRGGGSGR
jgi:hypothetical protein